MIQTAHFITSLGFGGAERTLINLVTATDRKRFSHTVVSLTDAGSRASELERAGVPVISLGMTRGGLSPAGALRAAQVLRRLRPRIVQTWLYHADLLGLAAAKLAGIDSVVWNLRCSDMDFSRYRPLTRWIVRLLALLSPLPAAVAVNSEAGRAWHERLGYRPRRWVPIPNGVDTAVFRPDPAARARWRGRLGAGASDILVGMIARRDPMKDHEGFLAAAARAAASESSRRIFNGGGDSPAAASRPGFMFVLAGEGIEAADSALSALAGGISAPVRFLGPVEDISGLTSALDIAVLASRFGEGFPNAVIEAMASAVPCVVTDVGDCARIVGATGLIVPPGDAARLAGAILALASPEGERGRMGEAARQRIEENFGLARMVARYEALYAELAGERA